VTSNQSAAPPTGADRVRATPYARRLARERGQPLAAIRGTGPSGRIVGQDVATFVPTPTPTPVSASAAEGPAARPAPAARTGRPVAAFAAEIDLTSAVRIIGELRELAPEIGLIDLLLKAAATAVRLLPRAAANDAPVVVGLAGTKNGGRDLAGLDRLALRAIAVLRAKETSQDQQSSAALSLTLIERSGIRPLAAPVPAGRVASLMVAAGGGDRVGQCLLSYDPAALDAEAAADLLLSFKTFVEIPLRLLA